MKPEKSFFLKKFLSFLVFFFSFSNTRNTSDFAKNMLQNFAQMKNKNPMEKNRELKM